MMAEVKPARFPALEKTAGHTIPWPTAADVWPDRDDFTDAIRKRNPALDLTATPAIAGNQVAII
jgi:hypothetical protein